MLMSVRLVQPLKARSPILVTELGMLMSVGLVATFESFRSNTCDRVENVDVRQSCATFESTLFNTCDRVG